MACGQNGGVVPVGWPYDYTRPWDFVFAKVLTYEQNAWWHKELEYPALLIVTAKISVGDVLGGDAMISRHVPATSPPGLDVYQAPVPDTAGVGAHRPRGGEPRVRPWEAAARQREQVQPQPWGAPRVTRSRSS